MRVWGGARLHQVELARDGQGASPAHHPDGGGTLAADATVAEFRATMALFATGVTVMTARGGGLTHGMTANAFTSVSLDPLLVLVCVGRSAEMHRVVEQVGSFGISILAADQERLARWFASSGRPQGLAQFDGIAWWEGPVTGAPMLHAALAWLECRVHDVHDGGDHLIYVGRVVSMARDDRRDPLLWFDRTYRRLPDAAADPEPEPVQVPNSRSPKSPSPGTM